MGGEAVFRRGLGPLLPGCEHVPPPDNRHCPFHCGEKCSLACADYVEYVLEKEGDVAAVIAETVRCTPFIPPLDYWKRVRAACDKHGALTLYLTRFRSAWGGREDVRMRALRGDAGHARAGQGIGRRRDAAGGAVVRRAVQRGAAHGGGPLHAREKPGGVRGGAGDVAGD